MPMLEVLRQASERVFVPLTVGGGIRGLTADGKSYSALEVSLDSLIVQLSKIRAAIPLHPHSIPTHIPTHIPRQVASEYFRSGADKISIGSDAVEVAEAYIARGGAADGSSSIEQISEVGSLGD